MTDTAATRPYGVLGRVLGHSYTPAIYKELAGLEYVRFEREPEDLSGLWRGPGGLYVRRLCKEHPARD